MKPNNVFLFYYSLAATTILLLASYFILPKPQNIANTILLAPVVFFLWTHALNPDFFSVPKWSPKFGAITIVFCLLGIFSYFLFTRYSPGAPIGSTTLGEIKQSLNQSNADDKEFKTQLEVEISQLKTKIDSLGNRDLTILGTTSLPESSASPVAAIGQITVKDANLTTVAIYETGSPDSKVTGSAQYGVVYPFYEKTGDWYKVSQGWVEARWFTEVNP
ncbi:MAG: hypothetical protein NTZ07_01740 [Candidatus Woesebacteria bacterium]|nr:hypothetical protein [Candidatus Woesebacteria bacterium]